MKNLQIAFAFLLTLTLTACVHIGEDEYNDHDHEPGEHIEEGVEMSGDDLHEDEHDDDDHEDEETEEILTETSDSAAGTQLAGSDVTEGENLVGGDAVASEVTPGEASFTIIGGNYYYDLDEITVKEGDTVTINFRSAEGYHDIVIDELDAHSEHISAGQETVFTFVASKKGTFEFYCSVGSHRANGMVGTLIVE